jgi:hypothetical protein
MNDTKELDFIGTPEPERWAVYAKDSYFILGHVAWSESKKAFDYFPNTNGKMMKITQQEVTRNELLQFCGEQTEIRLKQVQDTGGGSQ